MLEEVKSRLRVLYDSVLEKPSRILDVFKEQFGEENVDSNMTTFEEFLEKLSHTTMGNLGITQLSAANEFGRYTIDRADYEANGRGKSILEYMPDLGMLDYLKPVLVSKMNTRTIYEIIVHFPSVRVTNEFDKYVDIQDLYAKVNISSGGEMTERFCLARTTYPYIQFRSGYAHSHLPRIGSSSAGQWQTPCLGSGPIYRTILSLEARYDLDIWGLFAFELSKYVTVESISGVPYIRLESIGGSNDVKFNESLEYTTTFFNKEIIYMIDRFVKDYAQSGNFKVKFVNGQYHLGESVTSFCIRCSNAFIKWYNEHSKKETGFIPMHMLFNKNVIGNYVVNNGSIYTPSYYGTRIADAQQIEGRELFRFKGEMVKLHIILDNIENSNECVLFSDNICAFIISKILNIVNYKYGKRNNRKRKGSTNGPCEKLYII